MFTMDRIGIYKGEKYKVLDELPSDFFLVVKLVDCEGAKFPIATQAIPKELVDFSQDY